MAIQTGLGDYIAVDDSSGSARDISDNVQSYEIGNSQNLLDSTTVSKSALQRLIALGDLQVTINGMFDAASNKSHDVFKTKSGTRTFDLRIGGNSSSNPQLTAEMLVADYNLSRGTDGALNFTASLMLQSGTVPTWGTV
tara:strand:- start:443 stop:859 length:417 start_codon:yes stop_codon:yes gene_type:complete